MTPKELCFGLQDTPDGPCVTVCPEEHWEQYHTMYDDDLDVEGEGVPDWLAESPDAEATWVLPDGMTLDEAREELLRAGLRHEPGLDYSGESS